MSTPRSARIKESAVPLHTCKARHDYQATVSDQISFKAGDQFHITAKNGGWWLGVRLSDGLKGFLPSNYLSIIGADGREEKVTVTPRTAAGQGEGSQKTSRDNEIFSAPLTDRPVLHIIRGLYNYKAQMPDQLSFLSGEILTVIDEKQGWFKSVNSKGELGYIPSNYVEILKSNPPDSTHSQSSSPRPELPPLQPGMTPRSEAPTPRAPDLPDGYNPTPRAGMSGMETPEEEYRDQVADLTITPRMQQSGVLGGAQEKVRALFNFTALKPDQLSFKKGDIMVVIKKKSGWMKVHPENQVNKLGYIPSNYVKSLVEIEPAYNSLQGDFEPSAEKPLLVKAAHTYKALANNQLSFTKNELLHVVQKSRGWWKAYRIVDSEKIGYIPSNYVKIVGSSEENSTLSISAMVDPNIGKENKEEDGETVQAIHDLPAKDAKCLTLVRNGTYTVLSRDGAWWKLRDHSNQAVGLAPSNYLKVIPKESTISKFVAPPPRGTTANRPTTFVEGLYNFKQKKPTQLSFNKYDCIVVTKKEGSWWSARSRDGQTGLIPSNYVKEVTPNSFSVLHEHFAVVSDELTIRPGMSVIVLNSDNPDWWFVRSDANLSGFVPSACVWPNSTRIPNASPTPRTDAPDVPMTPGREGELAAAAAASAAAVIAKKGPMEEKGGANSAAPVDPPAKRLQPAGSAAAQRAESEPIIPTVIETGSVNNPKPLSGSVSLSVASSVKVNQSQYVATQPPAVAKVDWLPSNLVNETPRPVAGAPLKKGPATETAAKSSYVYDGEGEVNTAIGSSDDPRAKPIPEKRGVCTSGWQDFFGIFGTCGGARTEEQKKKEEEEKAEKEKAKLQTAN